MSAAEARLSYEAIREALRERGYLATPLERWFLGGALAPGRGSLRRKLISAALAGLLGGPLLGVLLAAELVAEGRGAVPVWPDGLLYAVLFALVLGVIVAAAELVAGVAISALGRRPAGISPRRAAAAAGLTVAAALAVYFGSWWVRGGADATLRDIAGLLVLALGAGFAGRVVAAAALVQATLALGRAPRRRRPRLLLMLAAFAVGVAALAAAAPWVLGRAKPTLPPQAGDVGRTVLIAWDGLSDQVAGGLLATASADELTALRRLRFAVAAIKPDAGQDPVAVWTTVATGSPPGAHGVGGVAVTGLVGARAPAPDSRLAAPPLDLLKRLWPTERRVVRAGVRRIPAFWEVAALYRRTAVVGWWGTWPAAPPGPRGGYLISDGALVAVRSGKAVERAIYPGAWGASRAQRWLERAEADVGALPGDGEAAAIAREARVIDLFALAGLEDALADPELGAATVYLPGLDILRERWQRLGRDPFETLRAVREHAEAVSGALTRAWPVLAGGIEGANDEEGEGQGGPGRLVWLVGLPGRSAPGEQGFVGRTVGLVEAACEADGGEAGLIPTAVAPSWLAASGLPVDDRMVGPTLDRRCRPRADAVRARTPAEPVRPGPEAGETLERDFLDRLKSLGYVQ